MEGFAIKLQNVSKSFKLPHEKNATLKGALINFAKRGYEVQKVFTNLSLTVPKGEFLGILGRNGSGKSTLLKTLSGIYSPDSGDITINGKLTPFIELGVGFNPELSGRDNVYLNGALLGFSRKEINVIYDEIVAFAELERFMDQKLKNYSSGMQVRLAFSIAIRANTDILVLDEVLAVGDEAFQRKCYDYFNELKLRGKTVILVTHDMSAVKRFCTKAVVIEGGQIIYSGDTEGAAEVYRNLNLESTNKTSQKGNKRRLLNTQSIKKGSRVVSIETVGEGDKEKTFFGPDEKIIMRTKIKIQKRVTPLKLNIVFNNPGGVPLTSFTKILDQKTIDNAFNQRKDVVVSWIIDGVYNDGKYLVSATLSDLKTKEVYSRSIDGFEFNIDGWDEIDYIFHMKHKSTVEIL